MRVNETDVIKVIAHMNLESQNTEIDSLKFASLEVLLRVMRVIHEHLNSMESGEIVVDVEELAEKANVPEFIIQETMELLIEMGE